MKKPRSNPKEAIAYFCEHARGTMLDIGAGDPPVHAHKFQAAGLDVYTNDLYDTADYVGMYTTLPPFEEQFDNIWCSHILEHQRNVGVFLDRVHGDLKEGGLLAITVPPFKPNIVGGHLTLWNMGLLMYNLILARFDCSGAWYSSYGYHHSIVLAKRTITLPPLSYGRGDIEALAPYFPIQVRQGFHGELT